MKIKELDDKLKYYREQADKGYYHNPFEYQEEMDNCLEKNYEDIEYDSDYYEYEDKIHEIGMEFYNM